MQRIIPMRVRTRGAAGRRSAWPRARGVVATRLAVALAAGVVLMLGWLAHDRGAFDGAWTETAARIAPVEPRQVRVVDGDTIRVHGQVYRLVGFDAPESGSQARCPAEQALAARATERLRRLVAQGELRFRPVACACEPGTEGTRQCNHGRLCGTLTAAGHDVGTILIAEGLARRYVCDGSRCPRRQSWCRAA